METPIEDVDFCWARLVEDGSLDETSCDKPSIDHLGLCAEHRSIMVIPRALPYRCTHCDVTGKGSECWCCGESHTLDVTNSVLAPDGGTQTVRHDDSADEGASNG